MFLGMYRVPGGGPLPSALVVRASNNLDGLRWSLTDPAKDRWLLGAAFDADFRHESFAGYHAVIARGDDEVEIKDLGSPMGTFVDGARIGRARLVVGSVLGVGRLTLVAASGSPPQREVRKDPLPVLCGFVPLPRPPPKNWVEIVKRSGKSARIGAVTKDGTFQLTFQDGAVVDVCLGDESGPVPIEGALRRLETLETTMVMFDMFDGHSPSNVDFHELEAMNHILGR
jgi:hypothetical protein